VAAEHRRRGVVLEGYSPFKNTDLRHPVLVEIAARHGVTPAQVVVRWHVDHQVVVISKSANRGRIAANFDVFGFSLSDEERARIDGLSDTRRR
jgi:diketogulonate reductase-like aldo/keto reductase